MGKKTVLGIDIGYDQLKLALVDGGRVIQTGQAQMPENLLKEGRFTSLESMASLIRECMKDNGMKATRAAVVLPNELVYVKNVDMPLMTEEQLNYNLPFEFHDYITGEVQDYIFDYAVIGLDEDTGAEAAPVGEGAEEEEEFNENALHLMAVGVERTVVEDIQAMLRKAGLKLVKTAPALCTYISLIRQWGGSPSEISDEIGVLDIGHHSISMYMFKRDQHIATREFEMGMATLDDIVADKFGVEKHLAHTYILSNFEDCLNSDECMGFYDNIAVELMRAINFYEFSNQGSSVTDLWIGGGGAVIEPLIRTINETLEANLHPAFRLLPEGDNDPQNNSLVQAIGVTLEI